MSQPLRPSALGRRWRQPRPQQQHTQRGISLLVVLMLLVIVSLLGAGAAQISLLGERSSRNDRDGQVAWQAAEAALADAELDIRQSPSATAGRSATFGGIGSSGEVNVNDFGATCGTSGTQRGLCAMQLDASARPVWLTTDFLVSGNAAPTVEFGTFTGRQFTSGTDGIQPSRGPRYIVELVKDTGLTRDLSQAEPQYVFRVTAMGFGPRDDIQAVLQMIYRN